MLECQTSSHHLFLEMGQLHVPELVLPDHLPSLDEVLKIEVLKPLRPNTLALSLFPDFSRVGIREEVVSPMALSGQTSVVSGPTSKVTLMKTVDELVWANSQMLECRGIFTVGLLQPLEFDIAVRGPKTR